MPVDMTIPNSIIAAYAKGVALRQQKEKQEADLLMAQEQMKMTEQIRNQNLELAKQRFQETARYHDLQDKAKTADRLLKMNQYEMNFNKGISQGLLRQVDPNKPIDPFDPTSFRPATKEEMDTDKLKFEQNKISATTPLLAERAGQVAQAQIPSKSILMKMKDEFADQNARDKEKFLAQEYEKNRVAAMQRTLAAGGFRKQEREAMVKDSIDASYGDVFEGRTTLEDLNRQYPKETGARVINAYKGDGLKIIGDEDRDALKVLAGGHRYLNKLLAIHNLIKAKGKAAFTDSDYYSFYKDAAEDSDLWSRNSKGMKGAITERDTQRVIGGMPSQAPGTKLHFITDSIDKIIEQNQTKINNVIQTLSDVQNRITYGMMPGQSTAVLQRFLIPELPPLGKGSGAVKGLDNLKPESKLPKGFELVK